MRISRRGCFYQGSKEYKYIWRVYNVATGLDESTATTGSFTLSSTRTKMASTSYTYNGSTFTLTNPSSTTATNLAVGQYVVNVTTSSNSSTSGTYLYLITGKSGSSSRTFRYKRYTSVKSLQGSTYYYNVGSDTMDYPVDGEQDDLWYVLVKGERAVHVWDLYDCTYTTKTVYKESSKTGQTVAAYPAYNSGMSAITLYAGTSYSFDETTGLFRIENWGTSQTLSSNMTDSEFLSKISGKYWSLNWEANEGVSEIRYSASSVTSVTSPSSKRNVTGVKVYTAVENGTSTVVSGRGDARGETAESDSSNTYPHDGYVGDTWYVYRGYEVVSFDNREQAYVWDVFNATGSYGYKVKQTSYTTSQVDTNGYPYYVGSSYSFDTSTGLFTINNATTVTIEDTVTNINNTFYQKYFSNTYSGPYKVQNGNLEYVNYLHTKVTTEQAGSVWGSYYRYTAEQDPDLFIPTGKGEPTGTTVKSFNPNAYPQDGVQGATWYTFSHLSDEKI